jgi:hypothetical protein
MLKKSILLGFVNKIFTQNFVPPSNFPPTQGNICVRFLLQAESGWWLVVSGWWLVDSRK